MISSATHSPLITPVQANPTRLASEQKAAIQKLAQDDREVRAHEQAHLAAGGRYVTGGPSYTYQQGPDGKRYAVGGEVGIDSSPESDPEATIAKMQVVHAAALAPADPSGQDQKVAAQALAQMAKARLELQAQQADQRHGAEGAEATESLLDLFV